MEAMVIGGGVAGPVAALALRRIGWDVTVYEAYADPAGDVGSFVSLSENGLAALAAVGARAAVEARGTHLPLLRLRSGRGGLLGETRRPRVTLMRGHLVETLRDLAIERGARIVTGHRLTDVHAGEAVFTTLQDTRRADLIVGADGIHSRLRDVIDPSGPAPRYAGLWSIGGRSTRQVPADGAFTITFGRRATFVHAPTPDGTLWAAQVPAAEQPAGPPDADRLAALYQDDDGPAAEIIRGTGQWHPFTVMRELPRVPTWYRNMCVLIGDAAHPMGAGQGAALAVEDAVVLARNVRDARGVPAALKAYALERRPRVDRMLKAAGANRDAKVAGPLAAWVRDRTMPVLFRRYAEPGSAWMTGYDVAWNSVSASASSST